MNQEFGDLFFNRPILYFGSYQEIQNENQIEDSLDSLFPFSLNVSCVYQIHHPTNLYLHWSDESELYQSE